MHKTTVFTQSDHFEGSQSSDFLHNREGNDSSNGNHSGISNNKAHFIGVIKHTGEPLARIFAQTFTDKMALYSLIRSALFQLEEELKAGIPLVTVQDQVSNIRKAA